MRRRWSHRAMTYTVVRPGMRVRVAGPRCLKLRSQPGQPRHHRSQGCKTITAQVPADGSPLCQRQTHSIHDERKLAAGRLGGIGWHTYRYMYRSWLDESEMPMKVQQRPMRDAATNAYGPLCSSRNGSRWELRRKSAQANTSERRNRRFSYSMLWELF